MKTMLGVSTLLLAGLAGCTGTQERSAYVAPVTVRDTTTIQPVRTVTNSEYVAYVEAIARRRGIDVQWVNPPTRREVASR